MSKRVARPYCKLPAACAAGTRPLCRMCHDKRQRRDVVVARYDNGSRTMKDVAAYFGISRERVRRILNDAGVKPVRTLRSRADLNAAQYRRFRNICNRGIPAAVAHEEVRRR